MPIYDLPKIKINKKIFWLVVLAAALSTAINFFPQVFSGDFIYSQLRNYFSKAFNLPLYQPQTSQEEAIIGAVKTYSPAVVSIVISKDVPILEQYYISPFNDFFGQPLPGIQIPQVRQ